MAETHVQRPTLPVESWVSDPTRTRLSLRALLGGVVVGLISQVVLLIFGAAIGLTAFEPEADVARGIGIGMAIWVVISMGISTFIGAYITQVISRSPMRRDGAVHGIVTWGLMSLVGLFLLGGVISNLAGGALTFLGPTARRAVESQAGVRPEGQGSQAVREQARGLTTPRGKQEVRRGVDTAATGVAVSLWGLLLAHLIALGTGIAGGLLGAAREARGYGLPHAVARRDSRITVHGPEEPRPTTTAPQPT